MKPGTTQRKYEPMRAAFKDRNATVISAAAIGVEAGIRGSSWDNDSTTILRASYRISTAPLDEFNNVGFRVASIPTPEPSAVLLALSVIATQLLFRRDSRF